MPVILMLNGYYLEIVLRDMLPHFLFPAPPLCAIPHGLSFLILFIFAL